MQTLEDVLERVRHFSPADKARVVSEILHQFPQEEQQQILNNLTLTRETPHRPLESWVGLVADLGDAPTEADIEEARRDMWAGFYDADRTL